MSSTETAVVSVPEFDLTLEEKYIKIKENGIKQDFVVVEMTGKARDAYMNDMGSRMKVDPDTNKILGFTALGGTDRVVVKGCLKRVLKKDMEKPLSPTNPEMGREDVGLEFVDALPARVQEGIAKIAREVSALDKEADERSKKDLEEKNSSGSKSPPDSDGPSNSSKDSPPVPSSSTGATS